MAAQHSPDLLDLILSYGLDVRARRIYLQGALDLSNDEHEIGKRNTAHVIRSLQYLDRASAEPIELWICTPGGPSPEMFAVYDVIRSCRSEIHTIGHGEICSAGVLLLAAGDRRFATKNAWLMSHAESGDNMEFMNAWATKQRVNWIMRSEKRWAELMAHHTEKTTEYWHELHQGKTQELWLDTNQMLRYNIIDEVWVHYK